MNTLNELLEHGIDKKTAIRMLESYNGKIGLDNGDYRIIDVTYVFDTKCKDVVLRCNHCGNVIHRSMKGERNKWSELIKNCECQKEKKRQEKEIKDKNFKNKKKDEFEKELDSFVGTDFGDYLVEKRSGESDFIIKCKECGAIKISTWRQIKSNSAKARHCTQHYKAIKYDESYIGKKKNYLKVIGITRANDKHRFFLCQCDCGKVVTIEPCHWAKGVVKSCGCFADSFKIDHTEELDRLRRIHSGMMQRCYNPNAKSYENYGKRGVSICSEWHDRDCFIEWALDSGYDNNLSIDRIDNNGNYEPSNCRWADAKTQANNQRPRKKGYQRKLKLITIDGMEKTLGEWYVIYEVTAPTVAYRMKKFGLSFEEALKMTRMAIGRPRKGKDNAKSNNRPKGRGN